MLKKVRKSIAPGVLVLVLLLSITMVQGQVAYCAPGPVNPNSTAAVSTVLNYFATARAQNKFLSGQYQRPFAHTETNHVYSLTGKYPAIVGYDMLTSVDGTGTDIANERQSIVNEAISYWNAGGLVSICWHETNPYDTVPDIGNPPGTAWDSVSGAMTQSDFNQVITPGTAVYNKWLAHIDLIAGYLKQLRDAGVVVLWRPYHEMNGNWFWWGGKTPSSFRQLWINMYNRFTNYHGLNNLIWVWGPNTAINSTSEQYYTPGYVDLGGADNYIDSQTNSSFSSDNAELSSFMGSRSYGLTECGVLPLPANMQSSFDYSYFMIWDTCFLDTSYYGIPDWGADWGNTPDKIQAMYSNSGCIDRASISSLAGNTHSGTKGAKAVLSGSPTYGNLCQTTSRFARNTSYNASFWLKGSGKVSVRVLNTSWADTIAEQQFTATSTWTKCTLNFNSGNNTSLVFDLYDTGSTAGTIYIDDCFIGTGSTNKLSNPGFESGTGSWSVESPFSILQP